MLERCARKGAILLLACAPAPAIFAAPPAAATNLSVDQMDQLLKQMYGQSDVKVARRIAGIQLTERAGAARLAQWEADLPGDRSRKALMEVGDASAFLDLPAAETPSLPPPDAETRKQILARAWDYVEQTLPRFPNFFANRTSISFAFTTKSNLNPSDLLGNLHGTPRGRRLSYEALGPAQASDSPEPQLFWLGSSTKEVTYRSGMEVANSPAPAPAASRAPIESETNGEFGAFLGLVVLDIPQEQTWTSTTAAEPIHSAASIIADAVTMLSNNWQDAGALGATTTGSLVNPTNPGGQSVPAQTPNRIAVTTYYRTAIAAGKNIAFTNTAQNPEFSYGMDGGVHNFLRFLEDWGGISAQQQLYYKGSIVSMYWSQYATGPFKCCNTVYNPPDRQYTFDSLFSVPSNLPPATPMFRNVDNLSYRQNQIARTN